MTRIFSVTLLLAVMASGGLARAQSTGDGTTTGSSLPNGAQLQFQHLEVPELSDDKQSVELKETEATSDLRLQSFSLAACNCAKANRTTDTISSPAPSIGSPNYVGWFRYLLVLTASSGVREPAVFYAGTDCNTTIDERNKTCTKLSAGVQDIDNQLFSRGGSRQSFNLYEVLNADPGQLGYGKDKACAQTESNVPVFTFVSTTGSATTFDFAQEQSVGTLSTDPTNSTATGVDTIPPEPPDPTTVKATPSDQSINLSWEAQTNRSTDIAYFQALCADTTGSVVRHRAANRRYVTTQSMCPATIGNLTPKDLEPEMPNPIVVTNFSTADKEVSAPVGAFGDLNEAYICGSTFSGTATSLKIDGLENGKQYQVILLTVDLHGNYRAQYFDHTITPVPVTDFWEDLHDRDSNVEGGLCLLNETYGDDSGISTGLRAFRDDTLASSAAGRWLVRAYYATLGSWGGLVHGSLALRIVAGVVLAPLVALALLWHALTLPGLFVLVVLARLAWRHRRALARVVTPRIAKLAGAGAAVIALAVAPGLARAEKGQPYWEVDPLDGNKDNKGAPSSDDPNYDPQFDPTLNSLPQNNDDAPHGPGEVAADTGETKWILGARVGRYIPDIDRQLGATGNGPYKQMFGGYSILPMIDFDRVIWSGFGQLTVGLSAGFLRKTADAFVDGSPAGGGRRERVPGATNTFTVIPFAVMAGYRFTWLDDNYSIPLVPYVRGGFAYYPWWVSAPSGGFAEVCKGTGTEPDCDQNKALGASLGVQGAIGVAIRAENISGTTAQQMRQSGLQHAGIYGEYSIARVDGFGSDKKLSVGDRTLFAGVNFEF